MNPRVVRTAEPLVELPEATEVVPARRSASAKWSRPTSGTAGRVCAEAMRYHKPINQTTVQTARKMYRIVWAVSLVMRRIQDSEEGKIRMKIKITKKIKSKIKIRSRTVPADES